MEREVKEQRDILRKALQPSVIERANARNRWSDMKEREYLIVNDKIEVGSGRVFTTLISFGMIGG